MSLARLTKMFPVARHLQLHDCQIYFASSLTMPSSYMRVCLCACVWEKDVQSMDLFHNFIGTRIYFLRIIMKKINLRGWKVIKKINQ